MPQLRRQTNTRFGIGEWYGRSFVSLIREERLAFASVISPGAQVCIPRSTPDRVIRCNKKGGVCSLRRYQRDALTGAVAPLSGPQDIVTLCPERFKEDGKIFSWIGGLILQNPRPHVVKEINFLRREIHDQVGIDQEPAESVRDQEDVGRIDYILANPAGHSLEWCAVELQAVYFSGPNMATEFREINHRPDDTLPFPSGNRRPDYRSSGPKRLMPQLQIKVPTLRRWGKKMVVVVDRAFFASLGAMDAADDISNSDIVWLIVEYEDAGSSLTLKLARPVFTTLERAVEGLIAGNPVSLSTFEDRILHKLNLQDVHLRDDLEGAS